MMGHGHWFKTCWFGARVAGYVVFSSVLFTSSQFLALAESTGQGSERCQQGAPIRVVAYGDSLTAGYGLHASQSFPAQLEKALLSRGHKVVVRNAGVSGDTTSSGLLRFDWAVPADTDAVILELGANDGLRGQPVAQMRKNLDEIITRLKARKIAVLVTGMRALNNWGSEYEVEFNSIFAALAKKHGTLFYPFFLEGVVLDRTLNLPDGLHPNGKGIGKIVKRISPHVESLLKRARDICE